MISNEECTAVLVKRHIPMVDRRAFLRLFNNGKILKNSGFSDRITTRKYMSAFDDLMRVVAKPIQKYFH